MAKLPSSSGGTGLQIADLAPAGQHVAVCLRVNDQFGVERPSFENPQVKEVVDVTRFVFGLVGPDGKPYLVQTYEFNISGAPGANLMKFLTSWLGSTPQIGWDYAEMLHRGAMLVVQHKMPRKVNGSPYAQIVGVSPVHPQLTGSVPQAPQFESMVARLENRPGGSAAAASSAPAPQGPPPAYPVNNSPVPPPPAPPAPVPPPPPPVGGQLFVHLNGALQKVTPAELASLLAQGQGAAPAIREGETQWRTVADYAPASRPSAAPVFPPPPPRPSPSATPTPDDDVPF